VLHRRSNARGVTYFSEKLDNPKDLPKSVQKELSSCWSLGKGVVNDFVSTRGDIAHTGSQAQYVTINNLKTYKAQIESIALDVDNMLTEYLCIKTPGTERQWRRRL